MEETKSGARPTAYWLIAKREIGRTEVLTVEVGGDEEAVPVFGFEEEAALFLYFEDLGAGWRVEKATAGEVRRMLFGPHSRTSNMVLDPLPAFLGGRANLLVGLKPEELAWGPGGAAFGASRATRRVHRRTLAAAPKYGIEILPTPEG